MIPLRNILLAALLFLTVFSVFGQQTANIALEIQSVEGTNGQLIIGIFDNPIDFKNKEHPYKAVKLNITDSKVLYKFSDIPNGNYALAVFHDANTDGKMNVKSMKIPVEGVGTSGVMPKMRAPKFADAKFSLENDTLIVIRLMYPAKE